MKDKKPAGRASRKPTMMWGCDAGVDDTTVVGVVRLRNGTLKLQKWYKIPNNRHEQRS